VSSSDDEPQARALGPNLTPNQYAQLYGLSIWQVRRQIAAGDLPSIRIGNRIMIPRRALDKLFANQADEAITNMRRAKEAAAQ
jgi:excisionase family DNA binding protein